MKRMILIVMIPLFLASCSNPTADGNAMDYNVLASEKTLPDDFHEIAFSREQSPHYQFLIEEAGNEAEFKKWWRTYGLEQELPQIDFSEKNVFFLGLQESGTCPVEIGNVRMNTDKDMMTVATSVSDGACTSDATPRTIVYTLDRSVAENIEVVEMKSGVSTFVPL